MLAMRRRISLERVTTLIRCWRPKRVKKDDSLSHASIAPEQYPSRLARSTRCRAENLRSRHFHSAAMRPVTKRSLPHCLEKRKSSKAGSPLYRPPLLIVPVSPGNSLASKRPEGGSAEVPCQVRFDPA